MPVEIDKTLRSDVAGARGIIQHSHLSPKKLRYSELRAVPKALVFSYVP